MRSVDQIVKDSGGVTAVARAMGLKVQTVAAWMWRNNVPATQVVAFSKATKAPCHEIRPDVFPPPTDTEAAE